MKIPQVGTYDTISHLQKSNNRTKIDANNETKIPANNETKIQAYDETKLQKDASISIPKGNASKIDFKA
jgi:hypothetical protein